MPISFRPLYQERVWGGRALAQFPGRELPGGAPIGESWEIVDRPEAQSVVRDGPWAGRTLRDLLREHAAEIMGPRWPADRPFPILVKWLDCRERLSLQVHPPREVAPSLGGQSKTENWFLADAAPGAGLILGLKPGVDRAALEAALAAGTAEACVERCPVARGDSVLVRSGTVHAIDAGCLILEVQENSDTTYRVYDWGRVGLDGKPRTLHVRESLASIRFGEPPPRLVPAARREEVLADAPEFRLRRVPLAPGGRLAFAAREQCRLVHVVEGEVEVGDAGRRAVRGDNLLVPWAAEAVFTAGAAPALLLVTENFA